MTKPRQKCDALIKRYMEMLGKHDVALSPDPNVELAYRHSKEIAISVVNEIMLDAESNWSVDDKNYEHSGHFKFWSKVKEEIIKR